jgi:hypothetical protein
MKGQKVSGRSSNLQSLFFSAEAGDNGGTPAHRAPPDGPMLLVDHIGMLAMNSGLRRSNGFRTF